MSSIKLQNKRDVTNIFQLMGTDENDITKSIAWTLNNCPVFLKEFVKHLYQLCKKSFSEKNFNTERIELWYQYYEKDSGFSDLEITDNENFYFIIEAKKGDKLPQEEQLSKYADRQYFQNHKGVKAMVSMSQCSEKNAYEEYAKDERLKNLVVGEQSIPLRHISLETIQGLIKTAIKDEVEGKEWLPRLDKYLAGVTSDNDLSSQWVYVVEKPKDWNEEQKKCKYPLNNGYPNYIAFCSNGKLESIFKVEKYEEALVKSTQCAVLTLDVGNNYIQNSEPKMDITSEDLETIRSKPVCALLDTLTQTPSKANTLSEAVENSDKRWRSSM